MAIETMPFSIIATVPMGADIVAAADHPAVGLLVDAWHVFRADTSLEELSRLADARDDLRRRARRRRRRGRRHAVRGHRRAPAAVRRRMFRPSWVGRACCGTKASTARGAWRSCRRRFGRFRFAKRSRWPPGRHANCSDQSGLIGRTVLTQNGWPTGSISTRQLSGAGCCAASVAPNAIADGHRGREVVDADVEVHLLTLRTVGPRRGDVGFRSHQRQHRSRARQCQRAAAGPDSRSKWIRESRHAVGMRQPRAHARGPTNVRKV